MGGSAKCDIIDEVDRVICTVKRDLLISKITCEDSAPPEWSVMMPPCVGKVVHIYVRVFGVAFVAPSVD
ncbi:hypothetical protein AVEN_181084-1, partial [Araneus ventricosus]